MPSPLASTRFGRIGLLAVCLAWLPACTSAPQLLGDPVVADTGVMYAWTQAEDGWALINVENREVLDSGAFSQVLGPVATPGGIAWAHCEDGQWSISQIGVSDLVSWRGQGASDALAAAWALERVQVGLVCGNAADLAQLSAFARTGEWPRPVQN